MNKKCQNILKKYPNCKPIIVDFEENIMKYIVPSDHTLSQLLSIIRDKIELTSHEAIYLLVNNTLPVPSNTIGQLYDDNKAEDGFLYMKMTRENTFG